MLDFGGQIAFLGLSVEEERVIEQSRQAYLLSQRLQSIGGEDTGEEIVSESDVSEGQMLQVEDLLGERVRAIFNKKRSDVRRKGIREVKRVSQVLRDCPGISQAIEDFVKACGAGPDAWWRTGALTFDGNKKIKQKATFKKITEHLEQKYNRSISYGSVVQLCVARNRRRRSAVRYVMLSREEHARDLTLNTIRMYTGVRPIMRHSIIFSIKMATILSIYEEMTRPVSGLIQ